MIQNDLTIGQLQEENQALRRRLAVLEGTERPSAIWDHAPDAILVADDEGRFVDAIERDRVPDRLHLQIDRLPLAYILFDCDFRVVAWNSAAEKIFGYTREEAIGQSSLKLLVPQPAPGYFHDLHDRLRQGDMQAHSVNQNQTKDGRIIACEWFNTPLLDLDGRFAGTISLVQDISERRQMEEKLKWNEALLAEAQQLAHVGSWNWDIAPDIVSWSDEQYRIFGLKREEMALDFENVISRIHPDDQQMVRDWVDGIVRNDREPAPCCFRVPHPDGSERLVQSRGEVALDAAGKPVRLFGTVEDITERIKVEVELKRQKEIQQALSRQLLTAQEKERRHLARELHDEFGQMLATVNLHLHAAKNAAGRAALAHLEECSTLLQQAGDQVRNLAIELRPTMLDVLGLEAALRWLVDRHRQRTGCEVELAGILGGAPLTPDLAIACFRVVQEALTNVVRHGKARHVRIDLGQTESTLDLIVTDDGVGFDVPATQQRATKTGRFGLLGMAERVQLLGGSLQIQSTLGAGTRIAAAFPLSPSPSAEQ